MPLITMKKVWNYCTYNKPFFILILLLLILAEYIIDMNVYANSITAVLIITVIGVIEYGYGMSITRDRINGGVKLPKIMIKDILVFGTKAYVVFLIYFYVQGIILDSLCSPLGFPAFDLEEMLVELPQTLNTLFSHNPRDALIFVVAGGILFYITAFFIEIALGRLADTNSIRSSFNIVAIKRISI